MNLFKRLVGLFRKKKEWWQEPTPYHDPYLEGRYGQPGTPLGDTPITERKLESSIIALPRWYKDTGYEQPNQRSK